MISVADSMGILGYVGPGLGLGAISFVLGVLLSVFLALLGVVWYPLKRVVRAIRSGKPVTPPAVE